MSTKTSSLEDHLGYWLRILSNEVSTRFADKLESCGVTVAQWVVLRILFDQKNATVVKVAAALDIDKGAVSRMIDRLLKLGLVRREESLRSRREVALSLTTKAQSLVPRLAKVADDNDREFFSALSARQKAEFLKTIQLLIASRVGNKPKPPTH